MTLNEAYQAYQVLVDAQSVKPTKKRIVEIRKSLIVLKMECNNMRKELLNKPKVEVVPEATPEVTPEVANEVKSPDPKLAEEDVSWHSPLPLTREVSISINSSEPVKSVEVKKEKKTRKSTKRSKQM